MSAAAVGVRLDSTEGHLRDDIIVINRPAHLSLDRPVFRGAARRHDLVRPGAHSCLTVHCATRVNASLLLPRLMPLRRLSTGAT